MCPAAAGSSGNWWRSSRTARAASGAYIAPKGSIDIPRGGEHAVGDLVGRLDLSQPGVSQYLQALREAGLVTSRKYGKRRVYSLRPAPLLGIGRWLEPYRHVWSQHLDALDVVPRHWTCPGVDWTSRLASGGCAPVAAARPG
ncbi:helix-turn-helix transcriptional regulator [Prescottella sp. R16]|uniref:ArsR/SmtB family transcription factor n=1 Tax=Prescottella sp. R16 TaxID=3064529 RepID=UPI00272E7B5A|nr:metalloregulator ArsR/SmtB family transcription factor [Prescottella sp. R16]